MKYSIIVTGYNCEKYVKECMDSIQAQTYRDFEVFAYNDASTDSTQKLLESYLTKIPLIDILYENPHKSGALNGRRY